LRTTNVNRATGSFKQLKRIFKAVIPVVQFGKVEIWFKSIEFIGLDKGQVFQNVAVQFRRIGKLGESVGKASLVSHVSHRQAEMTCAKPGLYVKSVSRFAWGEALRRTVHPQRTKNPHIAQG
jgi:hypothetical protein